MLIVLSWDGKGNIGILKWRGSTWTKSLDFTYSRHAHHRKVVSPSKVAKLCKWERLFTRDFKGRQEEREREKEEEMELKRNNSMTDFQSRNSNEFTGKLELHKRIKQVLHPIRKRREKTKVCLKDKTELFQKGILNCHLTICMWIQIKRITVESQLRDKSALQVCRHHFDDMD